jgi:hypothetical protein
MIEENEINNKGIKKTVINFKAKECKNFVKNN